MISCRQTDDSWDFGNWMFAGFQLLSSVCIYFPLCSLFCSADTQIISRIIFNCTAKQKHATHTQRMCLQAPRKRRSEASARTSALINTESHQTNVLNPQKSFTHNTKLSPGGKVGARRLAWCYIHTDDSTLRLDVGQFLPHFFTHSATTGRQMCLW